MNGESNAGHEKSALWNALLAYMSHGTVPVDGCLSRDDNAASLRAHEISHEAQMELGVVRIWGNFR